MIKFNVASINRCTETEGPHKRLCIWFQGCDIRCNECCNSDYQPFIERHIMSLDDIISVIKKSIDDFGIEGVTYSGGEPTCQQNLPLLTDEIKKLGLGVISFTGRKYEEVSDLLAGIDLVLDGEYVLEEKETKRRLLGSENQRILCLTDRYKNDISWFDIVKNGKSVEVNLSDKIVFNGDKI